MTDDELVDMFEQRTLPFTVWTHRSHLRVAYTYLRRHPLDEAVVRMRSGIQAYNAAHDVPEGLDRGYHETITQAWLRILHALLAEQDPQDCADAFLDDNAYLLGATLLRVFYSRERILSAEAKATFVTPDLASLPAPRGG